MSQSFADGLYRLPSFLSEGGRDLIPEMLLNDPVKRITIPEIRVLRAHPGLVQRGPLHGSLRDHQSQDLAGRRGERA